MFDHLWLDASRPSRPEDHGSAIGFLPALTPVCVFTPLPLCRDWDKSCDSDTGRVDCDVYQKDICIFFDVQQEIKYTLNLMTEL